MIAVAGAVPASHAVRCRAAPLKLGCPPIHGHRRLSVLLPRPDERTRPMEVTRTLRIGFPTTLDEPFHDRPCDRLAQQSLDREGLRESAHVVAPLRSPLII